MNDTDLIFSEAQGKNPTRLRYENKFKINESEDLVLIVEDDPGFGNTLSEHLKRLGYEAVLYSEPPRESDPILEKVVAGFIDLHLGNGIKGENLAKRILESQPTFPLILMSGNPDALKDAYPKFAANPKAYGKRLFDKGNFGLEYLGDCLSEIDDAINERRSSLESKVVEASEEFNVCIVGGGAYAFHSGEMASGLPLVDEVHFISPSIVKKGEGYKNLPFALSHPKIPLKNWHTSIEGFLEQNPSIVVFASGVSAIDKKGNVLPREELWKGTARKLMPYFEALKKYSYDGPIIIGSNPDNLLAQLLVEMEFDPSRITTGCVTDPVRLNNILYSLADSKITHMNPQEVLYNFHVKEDISQIDPMKIAEILAENYPKNSEKLPLVIGTHSAPIPILSQFYIEKHEWNLITKILRERGKYAYHGAKTGGQPYEPAEGIRRQVDDFTSGRKITRDAWSVYRTDLNAFLSQPVIIENGKIYPFLNDDKALPFSIASWEKDEFTRQEQEVIKHSLIAKDFLYSYKKK